MIIKPDGTPVIQTGGLNFVGDNTQFKSGGITFDSKGNSMMNIGGMGFISPNTAIIKSGNTYRVGGHNYVHIGNVLQGPMGKIWNGVYSEEDARAIIFREEAR